MSPKAEAANRAAYTKARAKADAKFRVAMARAKLLQDRANVAVDAANAEYDQGLRAADRAGRLAQWAVERKESNSRRFG